MGNISHFPANFCFIAIYSCFVIFSVCGNPALNTTHSRLNCNPEEHALGDVIFKGNAIFLKSKNITLYPDQYQKKGEKILVCPPLENNHSEKITLNCTKFEYSSNEFVILPNKSALVYGDVIPPEEYQLEGDNLSVCDSNDYADYGNSPVNKCGSQTNESAFEQVSIRVGQIGSGISIIALIIYLLAFCALSSLRSFLGYNLVSLSIAFILAYSFHLIGQIPEVLGLFCVISGVLQLNFFLSAFFCMNVLAFDVWRTLKLATAGLCQNPSIRQFISYFLYSWGCPLVITTLSVIFDSSDIVPENLKPKYGECDICNLNGEKARIIFLMGPAFTLLIINVYLFVRSFLMISSNKITFLDDQNNETVKFVLYLRLGIMMGMTWILAIIAVIWKDDIVWFISDLVNSLQGLFLLLIFTCRRTVMKHLKEKRNAKETINVKCSKESETTPLSKSSDLSSNNKYDPEF